MKRETKQDIVNRLQESLNVQQRSVPQLPAQAHPKKIKVLGSKADPKHPFSGYMVGADESAGNGLQKLDPESVQPGQEVIVYLGRDINNIDPKYLETAKVDEVVYANGKAYAVVWTERSGERKPSFDRVFAKTLSEADRNEMDTPEFRDSLAALKKQAEKGKTRAVLNPKTGKYIFVPVDQLQKKDVEETSRRGFLKGVAGAAGLAATNADAVSGAWNTPSHDARNRQQAEKAHAAEIKRRAEKKAREEVEARARKEAGLPPKGLWDKVKDHFKEEDHAEDVEETAARKALSLRKWNYNESINEAVANEDVLSALKTKLGDLLLQTLGKQAVDGDLKDKTDNKNDKEVSPVIKKITTDDGHEICIHGNEDDGFRISVRGKEGTTKFESLEHAEIASKMYCARRRAKNSDFLDEA